MRVDETKTAAGRRVIPLPAFAIAVLTERRNQVSMTQDRYMSRGRVHNQVAELLDRERSTATQGRH
ncbi:MAG: Integrase [Mycobacterium sp.]|jgi:hypothetical protein|nr:Integrase [Mycobacterium sp.]